MSNEKKQDLKTRIIYMTVLGICLLGILALSIVYVQMSKKDDAVYVGDGEVDYSVLMAVSSQEVLDFVGEEESGFLYAGRPTCPHCQVFTPILTEVVRDEELEVRYYDTDAANVDKELKAEALDAIGVVGVPSFLWIEKGMVADQLVDTENKAALIEFVEKYR